MLQTCVNSAGALCQLATSPDRPPLQLLATDQSIVLAVDSEILSQLSTEDQIWVKQVNNFLRRYTCTRQSINLLYVYDLIPSP